MLLSLHVRLLQGNDRLVKREYGALLAKYGLMRRLQVQKELAEEEVRGFARKGAVALRSCKTNVGKHNEVRV